MEYAASGCWQPQSLPVAAPPSNPAAPSTHPPTHPSARPVSPLTCLAVHSLHGAGQRHHNLHPCGCLGGRILGQQAQVQGELQGVAEGAEVRAKQRGRAQVPGTSCRGSGQARSEYWASQQAGYWHGEPAPQPNKLGSHACHRHWSPLPRHPPCPRNTCRLPPGGTL